MRQLGLIYRINDINININDRMYKSPEKEREKATKKKKDY